MDTQQSMNRNKFQFSLATILAVMAITAGLLTSLLNTGVIDVSKRNRGTLPVKQWEQIHVQSSRDALKVWQQIQNGANMATIATNCSLKYNLVDGDNPPRQFERIREQIQEKDTGELGPIVQIDNHFCVTRVTKRNNN